MKLVKLSKVLTKKNLIRFLELVALLVTILAVVPLIEQYCCKDKNKLNVSLLTYPFDGYSIRKIESNVKVFSEGLKFKLRLGKNDKTDDIIIDKISFSILSKGDCNLSKDTIDSSKINGAGSNVHGSIDIAIVNKKINTLFKYNEISIKSNNNIIYSSSNSKSTIFLSNNDKFIDFTGFITLRDKGMYQINFSFEYSYQNESTKQVTHTQNVYICK